MRSSPPPDSGFAPSRSPRAAIAGPDRLPESGSHNEERRTKNKEPDVRIVLRSQLFVLSSLFLVLSSLVEGQGAASREPSLDEVLRRAGSYVDNLHKQLSGIVAEETYTQSLVDRSGTILPTDRTLKSDLLLVRLPGVDRHVMFRDVFEVDGKPVRDREERLTRLFLQPSSGSRSAQLQEVINEGARYNVGRMSRNVNTPLVALIFLEPGMQPRMEYRRRRHEQPRGTANPVPPGRKREPFNVPPGTWVIEFKEVRRPTFIRTAAQRDFPASGRFWIDQLTGAVLVSLLAMKNSTVEASILVSYQSEPLLGYRVPVAMDEHYAARSETVDAFATYGRFRQFQVSTTETIGKPPGQW